MAIDERARHQLYLRLEEHLGAEAASTLMEHLPPVGWTDVATKRDLDQFADRLQAELYKGLAEQTRTVVLTAVLANLGSVLAVGGLAFAAARLT
jgi:hypothetical protein